MIGLPICASLPGRLLVIFTISLVLATSIRLVGAWKSDSYLGVASGSLVAMASDLTHGEFYRPLIGQDGSYGGTRYLPLYWVLMAGLMKAGVPPVAAGYVVSFFAIILLLFGMYFLLRTLGVGVALSVCGAILVLSSETVQFLLETIRSDALATALHIWGLVFCLSPIRKGWHLPAAAACFSLAFATKATSAIGLVAGFLILFLARRKRESFKLVAGTAVGCLAVLGFMYLGSTGRALEIIRKCASGGYPPIGIFRGSAFGLRLAWTNDHAGFLLFFLALATLLSLPRSSWKNTPTVLFVIFLGATIFIYAYLSQDENHLLDLVVASVVLAIPPLASSDEPDRAQRAGFRLGLLALIALLATGWVLRSRRDFQILPKKRDRLEAFRILHHVSSPVLAENPLIPVLLGQRAYVADPYMFGVLRKQDPSFAQPLLTKMRKHEFDAIVLFHDRQTARTGYSDHGAFGADFLAELDRSYQLSARAGENLIYRPRP